MHPIVLLGPQRFSPTVAPTLRGLGITGPIAVVTAGWQEREQEVDELRDHVEREVVNLRLYARAEQALQDDAALALALNERQQRLHELQRLYRVRLRHTLASAREMMRLDGRKGFVREQRTAAIRAVRALDRQHLTRIRRIHSEFEREWTPASRPAIARELDELRGELERVAAVAVAGGHVAVLLNRMRLFDLAALLRGRPLVAWSAGAMALADRVILFHDRPPQGPGDAELFESGLGLARGIVPLPHASARLDLDDPVRVALMARRLRPDLAALLDAGSGFARADPGWQAHGEARTMTPRGAVAAWEGA